MAVGNTYRINSVDVIPKRYKFNPYFDLSGKTERKILERKLRHSIRQLLHKTGGEL